MNVSQASKAVGKSRKTLYRHINDGKLSAEKDELDNTVIDVSELQRVYGKVDTNDTVLGTGQNVSEKQSATPSNDTVSQLLQAKLEFAEKERDMERERRRESEEREQQARDEVKRLLGIVETQTRQLTAPVKKLEETAVTQDDTVMETPKRGFWSRIFGGS